MSDDEQISGEDEIEINNENITIRNAIPNCLNGIIKIIFSPPGLVVIVIMYSVMGAFIFPFLEAPLNIKNNAVIVKSREECLKELWTITEKLNVLYEKNWTMLVHEQLRRFEGSIVAASRNGAGISATDRSTRWSFSEALLYSVTVITTIGHGNLTPKTSSGKIVTILYALIGVPLMLMCLSSLGGLLAEALQFTYSKFNCARNRTLKNSRSSSSCMRQSYKMNNITKYDSVSCETKVHNNYESTAVNEHDDSRHLLHNSPWKVNHTEPCIQVKTHPDITQYNIQNSNSSSSPLKHNKINKYNHNYQHQKHLHHQQQQHQNNTYQYYQMTLPHNYRANTSCLNSGITMDSCGGANNTGEIGEVCLSHHITGSSTNAVYIPITTTTGNNFTYNTGHPYNQQSLVKYHTIQLQRGNKTFDHNTEIATGHGPITGKYVPNQIPTDIKIVLTEEGNMSHNKNDILLNHQMANASCLEKVDIIEDDGQNDQNVMSCPPDTPSRIPLISSSTSAINNGSEIDQEYQSNVSSVKNRGIITNKIICGDAGGDQENCPMNKLVNPQVPITIVLCILTGYILLGTIIFSFWENWSFIDGAYFCFVTLSTIGYGDFLPIHTFEGPDIQLLVCCVYLLLGLVLVAMSLNILETQLMWKCRRIAVRLKLPKDY